MSKDERKKVIEEMAKKLVGLESDNKMLLVGYQLGKQEERQKWEKNQKLATTV